MIEPNSEKPQLQNLKQHECPSCGSVFYHDESTAVKDLLCPICGFVIKLKDEEVAAEVGVEEEQHIEEHECTESTKSTE